MRNSPKTVIKNLLRLEESSPVEDIHGNIFWRLPNGKTHRKYGPAVIWHDGEEEWYNQGKRHREDGPAQISQEVVSWYKEGKLHREDGPAREFAPGWKEYYINGVQMNEQDFNDLVNPLIKNSK